MKIITKYSKPDFLTIGAAKSGTTSPFHYLYKYPDVCISEIKECRFFSQVPKDNFGLNGAKACANGGIRNVDKWL